ncbi:MAG TPA: hypothetical protein DCY82_12570 [Acidimicrobiaceae bacterium]|nr:hypothetical protein [Acidimicrobiaceae bacterium]
MAVADMPAPEHHGSTLHTATRRERTAAILPTRPDMATLRPAGHCERRQQRADLPTILGY